MSDPIPPLSTTTDYYTPLQVYLVPPPKPRYWVHILLLLATIFTTLVVGARLEYNFQHNKPAFKIENEFLPFFPVEWALAQPSRLLLGLPFASTLMLILVAHEMGHYVCCRYYGVHATLPFFIPAPTLIGTLGAFIRIRSPIRSRTALFDIGIAGPIAGFVVALAVLAFAVPQSKLMMPAVPAGDVQLGYPLIFRVVWAVLPVASIPGASPSLQNAYFHPTAIAAWVGMFATALNLLPSGQLDGGHIIYALWPRAHRYISWLTVLVLVYLGRGYAGWRIWAALVATINIISWRQRQAPDFPKIRGARWGLALLGLLMLIVTLTPVPLQLH